jgi:low temperature requirement protein LtrA
VAGTGQALLIVAALFWAWAAYAWLTNASEHRDPSVRVLMFAAMAAMFVAAILIPALALGGGVALYLASLAAFRLRAEHVVDPARLLAAGASLACALVAMATTGLVGLSALAAVVAVLTVWEALRTTPGSIHDRVSDAVSPALSCGP